MRSDGAGVGRGGDEAAQAPAPAPALRGAHGLRALLADRERLALLDEAADRIGTSLDLGATCAELASFAVARFAQVATVEILPPEAIPVGPGVGAGPLRTRRTARETAPAFRDRGAPGALGAWVRHRPGCPTARCLEGGHAVLVRPGAGPSGAPSGAPAGEGGSGEGWPCEAGGGDAAMLVVPLRARGQLIGVLSLLRTGHGTRHDRDFGNDVDQHTVQAVADRAARSVDNARRHGMAQDLTMELQRALLADPGTPHANLELASRYLPCGTSAMVGGDWFESIRLSFGRTLLVIGDVMGHGVEAAVDMSAYRTLLRGVAAADLPPHRILRQLDHLTAQNDATRPATCLLGLIEPARRRATFASAGHLPPTLLSPDRPAQLLEVPTGPPLGTGLGDYQAVVHPLDSGQVLLLYTDGLVERRTEDIDASLARLARLGGPRPDASLEDLLDHVLATVAPTAPDDDIAVLAARARGDRDGLVR
ncbi:PP2C family protein-serine/threonine phosphatase [Kitasatospora nipponensis]|uniref:PP2C family protein-serine/threonine phosphatase n=1 Tax=Kitasatospora nipponensis TaxID=258049 RepID=UPI0031DB695A